LVVGGGVAGCPAAINAARKGVKVAVVNKGAIARSSSDGAGVDHLHGAPTNPCSKITPERMIERVDKSGNPYLMGHLEYIVMRESYDALLDIERMGHTSHRCK
jgi:succinate dehydrogenase/fumarate reductase flavoprotein subunit